MTDRRHNGDTPRQSTAMRCYKAAQICKAAIFVLQLLLIFSAHHARIGIERLVALPCSHEPVLLARSPSHPTGRAHEKMHARTKHLTLA